MTFIQAFVIAVLQGATELFPVSSLGHAVILPRLFGWGIDQKAPDFLPFLVVLHLGTAAALLIYFWRDWFNFGMAVLGKGKKVKSERKVLSLVIIATLPAIVLGFALEHIVRGFFGSPALAAAFLIVNGGILFLGERIKHRGRQSLDEVDWKAALLIGAAQALALIPGISRSGSTMVGGVMAGLTHKDSARFSFLLATPVILGAGVLEVPKLLKMHANADMHMMVLAGLVAGVTAYLSTAFLMKYFKQNEIEALNPFAYYCWAAGALSLAVILL
ncbi:MAG TPA: undecaprenyl-diphosphate phosphatase [Alphaproteobacteria bacterium]|nr:undecaprenyl-diphosphate phosphatase [Alphaproteobacteria bacterium]